MTISIYIMDPNTKNTQNSLQPNQEPTAPFAPDTSGANQMPPTTPNTEVPLTPEATPVYSDQPARSYQQPINQPQAMPPTEIAPQQPESTNQFSTDNGSGNTGRLKIIILIVAPIILFLGLFLIYLFPVAGGAASKYGVALRAQDLTVEDTISSKLSSTTSSSTTTQIDKAKSDLSTLKNEYSKTVSERPKLANLPLGSLNSNYKLAKQTEKDVKNYDQKSIELINQASAALNYVSVVYTEVDEFQKQVKELPVPTTSNLASFSSKVEALAVKTKESASTIEKIDAPSGFEEDKKIIVTCFNDLSSVYNKFVQAIAAKNTTQINEAVATERNIFTKLNNALKNSSLSQEFKSEVEENRELGDKIQSNLNKL